MADVQGADVGAGPVHPAAAADFDEIEAKLEAMKGGDANLDTKLEGDDIPEELRGKTISEVVKIAQGLSEAVRTSEAGRTELKTKLAAQEAASSVHPAAVPVVEVPRDEPKDVTDEELQVMYDDNPMKAIGIMQDQAARRIERNLAARVDLLGAGSADSAEALARQKYEKEFKVLGGEINAVLSGIKDRSVLSSAKSWDDLIAYVRGQPGSFEKLVAVGKAAEDAVAQKAAQDKAAEEAGASLTAGAQRTKVVSGKVELDDTQKDICKQMDMSHEDYVKWAKVGVS